MSDFTQIPEELKELVKEVVAYEELEEEEDFVEERLYIEPPSASEFIDKDEAKKDSWKIQINL